MKKQKVKIVKTKYGKAILLANVKYNEIPYVRLRLTGSEVMLTIPKSELLK